MVKERLFANPSRPASYASGGDLQVKNEANQITSFQNYFSDTLHLARNQYTLQPLKAGSIVVAGTILGRWCTALTKAFIKDGFGDDDAASLAVMSISALEGAIVLSRSTRCVRPLSQVGEQLEFLIKAREFVTRNGIPGKHDDT